MLVFKIACIAKTVKFGTFLARKWNKNPSPSADNNRQKLLFFCWNYNIKVEINVSIYGWTSLLGCLAAEPMALYFQLCLSGKQNYRLSWLVCLFLIFFVFILYSNITSFFRFVDKRAIYRWYNLNRTCAGKCDWLFHWQHKLCATFSANVNINYRLPIKVYYRICTLRHIRIEINHGSRNVFWVLTWVGGY